MTYDSGELTCGRERIRYRHLPQAHTDGDLYAFLPEANVLVTGDLLHVGRYPVIDYSTHGWIGGYLDATEALLQVADSQTRIVPGEGPVQTRAALEEQLALCKAVKDRLIESFKRGDSLEEFIASAPTRDFEVNRGDVNCGDANRGGSFSAARRLRAASSGIQEALNRRAAGKRNSRSPADPVPFLTMAYRSSMGHLYELIPGIV